MKPEQIILGAIGVSMILVALSLPVSVYVNAKLKQECIQKYSINECRTLTNGA